MNYLLSLRRAGETWKSSSHCRKTADFLAIFMAIALPWSTTAFSIAASVWFLIVIGLLDRLTFISSLRDLRSALPLALFVLAVVGMLWSDVAWPIRIYSASTLVKLSVLPLLIYQFQRSDQGLKILLGFYFSCTALLFLSWLNWLDPRTVLFSTRVVGVPVKNWITQGQEFVLCIFGSALLAIITWRDSKRRMAICFGLLAILFLLNMVFVVASRTALLSIPVLLLILTLRYIGWRRSLLLYTVAMVTLSAAWIISPYLRDRLLSIEGQYELFVAKAELNSAGLRIEYWSKSLKFIHDAPLIGHGTGSIRSLFEREATGKLEANAEIVANPHNQTLYFAIEWGVLGVTLLYGMWIAHAFTFLELRWISWIGLLIVIQNFFSSTFNSHLSDFVEGWIYVMGVGVTAGMAGSLIRSPYTEVKDRTTGR